MQESSLQVQHHPSIANICYRTPFILIDFTRNYRYYQQEKRSPDVRPTKKK